MRWVLLIFLVSDVYAFDRCLLALQEAHLRDSGLTESQSEEVLGFLSEQLGELSGEERAQAEQILDELAYEYKVNIIKETLSLGRLDISVTGPTRMAFYDVFMDREILAILIAHETRHLVDFVKQGGPLRQVVRNLLHLVDPWMIERVEFPAWRDERRLINRLYTVEDLARLEEESQSLLHMSAKEELIEAGVLDGDGFVVMSLADIEEAMNDDKVAVYFSTYLKTMPHFKLYEMVEMALRLDEEAYLADRKVRYQRQIRAARRRSAKILGTGMAMLSGFAGILMYLL